MDFRSVLDQVKQAFVIGKNNTFLHGRQGGQADQDAYEAEQAYQAPQQSYAAPYPQQGWQQPQQQQAPWQADAYQGQQGYGQQAGYQQPQQQMYQAPPAYGQQGAYQQPQQAAYGQQGYQAPAAYQQPAYQQPQQSYAQQSPAFAGYQPQAEPPTFATQIAPEGIRDSGRNRRSAQHQQEAQAPYAPPAPPENLVQFPGTQQADGRMVDAYVVNVFNITSCRQAMSCLRKGQCTLIVMDQLIDKAEIRRYVDMLTGACYALNGTMTRLSAKIGFYIMAPSGMTVYTDPVTSNANAQPRPQQQAPLYHAPTAPGSMPTRGLNDFSAQGAYAAVPQMSFSAHQPAQPVPQQESYVPEQESYAAYQQPEQAQRYAAL